MESCKSLIETANITPVGEVKVSEKWRDFDAVYLPGRVWIVFGGMLQFVELIQFKI